MNPCANAAVHHAHEIAKDNEIDIYHSYMNGKDDSIKLTINQIADAQHALKSLLIKYYKPIIGEFNSKLKKYSDSVQNISAQAVDDCVDDDSTHVYVTPKVQYMIITKWTTKKVNGVKLDEWYLKAKLSEFNTLNAAQSVEIKSKPMLIRRDWMNVYKQEGMDNVIPCEEVTMKENPCQIDCEKFLRLFRVEKRRDQVWKLEIKDYDMSPLEGTESIHDVIVL